MKIWGLLMVAAVLGSQLAGAQNEPSQRKISLTVSLTDGSRLIGNTELKHLPLHSEALGKLEIPIGKIRAITFSADHESLEVSMHNGDKLRVSLGDVILDLHTIVGEVVVPWDKVTNVTVDLEPDLASLKVGLIAYYPFRQDADDHSGNKNHGKVVGAEFVEGGLRFRGDSSTLVRVERNETLEPADALTISMWVKGVPGQAHGQGWGTVVRKCANCQGGYHFKGGGISTFYLDGNNPCATREAMSVAFRKFDETRWQHIAATCSGTKRIVRTYQDGELVNEAPLTVPLVHSGDLYIGGANLNGDDGGFRGVISNVRIYNRELTAAEIRALQFEKPSSK